MEIAKLVLAYLKVLAWPAVAIGAMLIFRAQIRDIASRVSRANFLGLEIEAAAREVSAAVEAAAEAETGALTPSEEAEAVRAWLRPLQPSGNTPAQREAMAAVNRLEQNLRRLAWEVDVEVVGRSTRSAAQALIDRNLLTPSFFRALDELLTIRDAHAERPITDALATELAGQARQLVLVLRSAYNAHHRTRVVGE
ncbi:hypothetical protein [Streptomyces adustus]|uniref:hypothetical protein n=1 Tax=Streptomyces adustus TaxID=1609272 RepID=UPI0037142F43